ncbi:MAG: hypothetical protein LBJ20_02390 [Candidatus Methanoplasma sp.]|jgi:hypothetical protein|nr:hypothetical protein [Candidatus Methanoplasma sp.]
MHCKDISLHDADFPLTEKDISEAVIGWDVYVRTEYLVLRKKKDFAVVKVKKEEPKDLFGRVNSVEIVSLPDDTVFLKDHEADVLNVPALARIQEKHPGKTVVIEGMFSHIGFVSGLRTLKLRVIDNIPPVPSKLRVLVDRALSSGFINLPVVPEYIDVDLSDKAKYADTEAVMFPCRGSGLVADIPVYFLDDAPDIRHPVTLIGCSLSKRIYSGIYGRDVPFINVCPADAVPYDGVKTIVKCCMVKEGHIMKGNTAEVPWGATVPEITDAINALFGDSE